MSERWEVDDWSEVGKLAVFSRGGNGYLVCTLDKDNSAKQETNAYRIAAANDLLEALEPFAEILNTALDGFTPTWEERHGPDHIIFGWNGGQFRLGDLQRARAAIAKAKGETQ